jgi:hypothetical protein
MPRPQHGVPPRFQASGDISADVGFFVRSTRQRRSRTKKKEPHRIVPTIPAAIVILTGSGMSDELGVGKSPAQTLL